ncbi:uncharacterized protein LOC101854562 [Aplysia californica]|uniref:Uncharacterized protein LOC101854562 n=1 Tax=Aplysia californica TaxID=6500 RepID=A0ABM0ZWL3_APLCA|nr:uncharacterized protein LOC101854562 [Aplysia californica]
MSESTSETRDERRQPREPQMTSSHEQQRTGDSREHNRPARTTHTHTSVSRSHADADSERRSRLLQLMTSPPSTLDMTSQRASAVRADGKTSPVSFGQVLGRKVSASPEHAGHRSVKPPSPATSQTGPASRSPANKQSKDPIAPTRNAHTFTEPVQNELRLPGIGQAMEETSLEEVSPFTYLRYWTEFTEPCVVTRPRYFDKHLLFHDSHPRRRETDQFARSLQLDSPASPSSAVCTICQDQDQIVALPDKFLLDDVPMSSLLVSWRLHTNLASPTLQMVFILLNRYSKLVSLVRRSANSACAVFETISGAERVMELLNAARGTWVLIVRWWHHSCDSQRFRHHGSRVNAVMWVKKQLTLLSGLDEQAAYKHFVDTIQRKSLLPPHDPLHLPTVLRHSRAPPFTKDTMQYSAQARLKGMLKRLAPLMQKVMTAPVTRSPSKEQGKQEDQRDLSNSD